MKKRSNLLTLLILASMVLGIGIGYLIFKSVPDLDTRKEVATNFKLLTTVFMGLVKMIIAPLVFSTLVVGISKLGDLRTVGRVGAKAMTWFITASLVSLLIGLFWVNVLAPGVGADITADASSAEEFKKHTEKFSVAEFVNHLIPTSVVQSMATNEILQIVIFSIFFGVACAAIGERAKPVIAALDSLAHIILKMVGYVMNFAPLGVLGGITAVVATNGLDRIFVVYAKYFGAFLVGIATLWVVLLLVGRLVLGVRMSQLVKRILNPMVIAFSTTSSEAVFPKMVEELERFGCKNTIVSFVLPLGYSFNLDGSMMYMTFASIFIAQVNGIALDLGTQLTMLLVLMLTSKGIAGVPRASLVVVTATCAMFGIPPEGIALIIPIDHFCDMFRSMTNVLGNALATSAVSKWEGELGPQKEIMDMEPLA